MCVQFSNFWLSRRAEKAYRSSSPPTAYTRSLGSFSRLVTDSKSSENRRATQSTVPPSLPKRWRRTRSSRVRPPPSPAHGGPIDFPPSRRLARRPDPHLAWSRQPCLPLPDGQQPLSRFRTSSSPFTPLPHAHPISQTFTQRDAGHSASLDWRDRKPIDEVLASLHDWDPVLRRAVGYFPSSLHWAILDEPPEEEWISEGGKASSCIPLASQGT